MTTMSATVNATRTTRQVRTGLAISAFLGLINIPFLFVPAPTGQDGPPEAILVLSALVGLVSVVCAVIAWRSGNRLAIRINAAALLLNGLTTLPAFFVDIDAWIKVFSMVSVILTVVALVLTLRREPTPYTVTD
jgi:hypothetical protein